MAFTRQVQGPGRAARRPVDPAVVLPPVKSVRLLDQVPVGGMRAHSPRDAMPR
jgi:hypothetical protein